MSQELLDDINGRLSYGDSRSGWVRDAIKIKMAVLDELEDFEEDMSEDERREFIAEAVQEAVEQG